MNTYTALLIICWGAAGLFSVAAMLNLLSGAVFPGALQALGAILWVAVGAVVNAKRRRQHEADT